MKNSQKGFVLPVLVTIIILAIIAGGVYLYTTRNEDKRVPPTPPSVESITFVTPKENESLVKGEPFTIVWNGSHSGRAVLKIESTPVGSNFSTVIGDYSAIQEKNQVVWDVPCNLDTSKAWYRFVLSDNDTRATLSTSSAFLFHPVVSAKCSTISNSDEPTPYIGSIFPQSARKGDTIEIRGSNLNGFEGDVYFFFKKADGKEVRLPGILSQQLNGDANGAQTAKVVLKEPCQAGETVYGDYSGIASQCNYVALDAGVYSVYTSPWGKKSNIISFSVVK